MAIPRMGPNGGQDVHILPIAREVDRAVLPFFPQHGTPAILHAHRVILLVPSTALGRRVAAKVERLLEDKAVIERVDMEPDKEHPTAGIQGILQQVSSLIVRERNAGNRVHINLSSGTKLVAFAVGLAAMAHLRPGKGSLYYVQPEGYQLSKEDAEEHGHTKGIQDVEEMELLPIMLPDRLQLRLLAFLRSKADGRASYRDMVAFLSQIPGAGYESAAGGTPLKVRNWNNAITTRMVRTLLSPLERQGLLQLVALGREKGAQVGERGILFAALSGVTREEMKEPILPTSTTSTWIHG